MEQLRNMKFLLEPVAAIRDGMGLSDREMACDSAGSPAAHKQHFGPMNQVQGASQCSDSFGAPSKKRPAGHPTTSRDKAPYKQPALLNLPGPRAQEHYMSAGCLGSHLAAPGAA
uniref:Uncharacterized protein n=1 Tax=Aegilops tauschii subsp. strangulata TaxID=200361 RepID=A0A452XKW8_AEGTS